MAEAIATGSSFFNVCPFCNEKFNDKYELRRHLEEMHNISMNILNKIIERDSLEVPKIRRPGLKESNLGNRMKMLKRILNEHFHLYLEQLKLWIHCDITRLEFDESIRPFFTQDTIFIHNEFLIAFLREIRSINKVTRKLQNECFFTALDTSAEMSTPSTFAQENHNPLIASMDVSGSNIMAKSDEMPSNSNASLPDRETVYALSIVSAWENDCPNVNRKVIPILYTAIEHIIKNISKAIAWRRKNIRVRADGAVYDTGKINPNDVNPEDRPKYSGKVTLPELLDALKAHPKLIPVKSLFDITMQTIVKSLENEETEFQGSSEEDNV